MLADGTQYDKKNNWGVASMQFVSKRWVGLAVLTAILVGLQTPFNSAMYAFIFKIISEKRASWIVPFVVAVILAYFGFALAEYLNTVVINCNVVRVNQRLKAQLLQGILQRRTVTSQNFVAKNLSFFMNDLKLLEDNYIRQLFSLISMGVAFVVTLGYALANSVSLTLVFLAFMVLPSAVPLAFQKKIAARTVVWSRQNTHWSSVLKDLLKGALVLQQYHAFKGVIPKSKAAIGGVEAANARVKNEIALSDGVVEAVFYVCMLIPIGIGIAVTIQGRLTLSQFVAIQYSSNWIINGARGVIGSFNTLNSTRDIRRRIKEMYQPVPTSPHTDEKFDQLQMTAVDFSRAETPILTNINLTVHVGEKILIQGESGSGKTTLLRLIDGALTPSSGQVHGNQATVTTDGGMSTVNQTPVVFNDTLRFNLTLGLDFTASAIQHACQEAGLAELIANDGLDYMIGDDGQNLSGGQVKRIEIARAVLFDRQVLLIDEGTASLDEQTSMAIHNTLLHLPKTIIEVDHHIPETVLPLFDHVYHLENGQLIQQS